MMQMHANLMCAATVQFAFNQTRLLAERRTRYSVLAARPRGELTLILCRCTGCRPILFSITPVSFRNFPATKGEVNLFHCARGELFR
jgi:hypothetical protein